MRRIISIVLIMTSAFLVPFSSAKAENWVRVATADENRVEAYVDVDSITKDGNKKRFWMYHDMKGKVKSRDGKPIEKAYGHAIVDCEAKTIGIWKLSFNGQMELKIKTKKKGKKNL